MSKSDYAAGAGKAKKVVEEKYASQISSMTRMKDEEINKLFPKPADQEKLKGLLDAVKGATNENDAINHLTDNIQSLAGTVVKLIKFAV